MIVGQSIFQLVTCLVLHFAGEAIFGYGNEPDAYTRAQHQSELSSLVFNTFVWCQIFNVLNARELGRNLNIFAGFTKNRWFLGIWAIMIGGQALIVNVGGAAFSVVRLGGVDWAISVRRRVAETGLTDADRPRPALAPDRRPDPAHPDRAHHALPHPDEAPGRPEQAADRGALERAVQRGHLAHHRPPPTVQSHQGCVVRC